MVQKYRKLNNPVSAARGIQLSQSNIVGGVSNPDIVGGSNPDFIPWLSAIGVRNPSNNRKMGLGNH